MSATFWTILGCILWIGFAIATNLQYSFLYLCWITLIFLCFNFAGYASARDKKPSV